MWLKQYRRLKDHEFIVVGGDCSQGGDDSNAAQFISKTYNDIPMVYHRQGVAAQMTSDLFPVFEQISDVTGVAPTVAFERNNGGASEMERLSILNRLNKFTLFVMPTVGLVANKETSKFGYDTSAATRPTLVGDLKAMVDVNGLGIYDDETVQQLFWFIINKGKAQATTGKHDDLVMALAIAEQLRQICMPPALDSLYVDHETEDLFPGGWRL